MTGHGMLAFCGRIGVDTALEYRFQVQLTGATDHRESALQRTEDIGRDSPMQVNQNEPVAERD